MKLFKINIFTPDEKYYFHTEEIYAESLNKCKKLYELKYPGYNFEIEEVI